MLVVVIYVVGAFGSGLFYPANTASVMKAAPPNRFGITSGLLRTFTNLGMVFSFAVAILVASQSIPRHEAFADLRRYDLALEGVLVGVHDRPACGVLLVDVADARGDAALGGAFPAGSMRRWGEVGIPQRDTDVRRAIVCVGMSRKGSEPIREGRR